MTKEINQGESGQVKFPDTITSGGLSPCIAVGLLNKKKKTAYLIHETMALHDLEIKPFLTDVLKSNKKEDLEIWVTGACIFDEDDQETRQDLADNRAYVKELLRSMFDEKQINLSWTRKNTIAIMTIDTEFGNCVVKEQYPSTEEDSEDDLYNY